MSPDALARVLRAALAAAEVEVEKERTAAHVATADDGNRLLGHRDCGVSPTTWRPAIRSGALRAAKIGREYRATKHAVDLWLSSRAVAPTPPKSTPKIETDDPVDLALARARRRRSA